MTLGVWTGSKRPKNSWEGWLLCKFNIVSKLLQGILEEIVKEFGQAAKLLQIYFGSITHCLVPYSSLRYQILNIVGPPYPQALHPWGQQLQIKNVWEKILEKNVW